MATADKKLNEVLIDVRGLRKQFGALQVLKDTKSPRMMWRYATFRPFAD